MLLGLVWVLDLDLLDLEDLAVALSLCLGGERVERKSDWICWLVPGHPWSSQTEHRLLHGLLCSILWRRKRFWRLKGVFLEEGGALGSSD